jgi:hypothetical protein
VVELPIRFEDPELQAQLGRAVDAGGRIDRALDALGPFEPTTLAFWPLTGDPRPTAGGPDPAPGWIAGLESSAGPGGRIIVVEDYGRDDVTDLLGGAERAQRLVEWSRRQGPFLSRGFRVRVLHCWWQWPSLEEAAAFLEAAFAVRGREVAAAMRRPRLEWKVAVYHRSGDGAR